MLDPDDYRVVLRRNQKPGSTMGQTDFHRAAFLGDLDRIEDLRRGGWEQLDVKNVRSLLNFRLQHTVGYRIATVA
jgi:hypothetical protein